MIESVEFKKAQNAVKSYWLALLAHEIHQQQQYQLFRRWHIQAMEEK